MNTIEMIGMQSEELIYKKVIVNLHTVIFLEKNLGI